MSETIEKSADQITSDNMASLMFDGKPIESGTPPPADEGAQQGNQPPAAAPTEQKLDAPAYLKEKFGWENEEAALNEIAELRKLKEEPPPAAEIKFANDLSKNVFELLKEGKTNEVRTYLEQQYKIESMTTGEVSKDNAEHIIKLQMELSNPTLTKEEIEFEYKQNFAVPKKPIQKDTEDDETYNERIQEWEERTAEIEMRRMIAAKKAQPELSKLKSELTLPDIPKENQPQPMKPEDVAAFKKHVEDFVVSATAHVNNSTGFEISVQDKDVNYNVPYSFAPEEKKQVNDSVNLFAENGLDANAIFATRWLKEDGKTINVEQMTKDLSLIYSGEKALQKIALDSANQRMELHLKEKKNINVNEQNQNKSFVPDEIKNQSDKMAELFFN